MRGRGGEEGRAGDGGSEKARKESNLDGGVETYWKGSVKESYIDCNRKKHIIKGIGREGIFGAGREEDRESHTETIIETKAFAWSPRTRRLVPRSNFGSQLSQCGCSPVHLFSGSCPHRRYRS